MEILSNPNKETFNGRFVSEPNLLRTTDTVYILK